MVLWGQRRERFGCRVKGTSFKPNASAEVTRRPVKELLLAVGFNPRDLRTHILRLLGPKTILYKVFGLF